MIKNGSQLAKQGKIIKTETYGMYQEAIIGMKTRQDEKGQKIKHKINLK